ncbi:MAG: Holliday junction branch migration protein RuvA [Planctomycetota bacterium]|nr:Holliday junction branch migration protein RuvA [Planctomycetota bacterium]
MITRIKGTLLRLDETSATLGVDPFEYEILIPDFTRRHLQMSVGSEVSLLTIQYIDGNVQKGGRMTPRLIGFNSEIEREFFELFCSVDGLGVKKALRAMVRPVQDVARAIEQQDTKVIATLPGIGPATAERIVAKLRRRMPKFALMVTATGDLGESESVERSVVDETFQILLSLGHSESDARTLLEAPLATKAKYKDVESLLQAVYDQTSRG